MKPIRVLLADDHDLFRAGIRSLLQDLAGIEVVAEAGDGREALRLCQAHHPDVALMDIMMPELNGLDAAARLAAISPGTRTIILSMNAHEEYVLQALRSGAVGYLLKNISPTELEQAIRAVARGETYLSPAISRHVIAAYLQRVGGGEVSSLGRLTPRQREVLQLIAGGEHDEGDRPEAGPQREDRGDASHPADGGARHPRHRRPGALCHPDGGDYPGRLATRLDSPLPSPGPPRDGEGISPPSHLPRSSSDSIPGFSQPFPRSFPRLSQGFPHWSRRRSSLIILKT